MTLIVVKPGMQTTLQGAPYSGSRHIGLPAAGAADSLSLCLANRLVGKPLSALAIEITLDSAEFLVEKACAAALTGAASSFTVNGMEHPLHRKVHLAAGDRIFIGNAFNGCRSYLALDRSLKAQSVIDGQSTYLQAGFGGFRGRSVRKQDCLEWEDSGSDLAAIANTPQNTIPYLSDKFIIRITPGPEFEKLNRPSRDALLENNWIVGTRANRMGLELNGELLSTNRNAPMPSAAVFPGTIQCPPDGTPFLLGPDAQTTGGYARVAQVILADRHLIGQMKPGSTIRFVNVTPEQGTTIYREKVALLQLWLGKVKLW